MADESVIAVCNEGHQFVLADSFTPFSQVIAAIAWCPEMVAREDRAGLILECGALVLWKRYGMREHWPGKRFRLPKDRQLDLFDDGVHPNEI